MINRQLSTDSIKKNFCDFDVTKLIEEVNDSEESFYNHKQLLISDEPVSFAKMFSSFFSFP